MSNTISPNMSLIIPGVGNEAGPTYAFDVNASLTLIDQHDHSPGRGIQITPAGININASLSMNGNDLTNIQTLVFTSQSSDSTLLGLYVKPGSESPTPIKDLWFNDGAGNQIQITSNGLVNATVGSLPGESYANGTFTWQQVSPDLVGAPANFDLGSATLRPNLVATTLGVTLDASSVASTYSMTLLPTLPAQTGFLTISNSGALDASIPVANGITAANIAPNTITAAQIAPLTITGAQIANASIPVSKLIIQPNLISEVFGIYVPSFVVRAATTVNGTLATAFDNGSVIDGVTLATNDIILVKNQTTSNQDGVYVVQASGAPVRHVNYDTAAELNFAGVHVSIGTANANTDWFQNDQLTTLTDPQSWSRSATQAFTVPAGITEVFVQGIGAGGGGGAGSTNTGGGGGGGQAALQASFMVPVTPGQVIPVTAGFGGVAGITQIQGGATIFGLAGSNSSFGTVTFIGGAGGGGPGGASITNGGGLNNADATLIYPARGGAVGGSGSYSNASSVIIAVQNGSDSPFPGGTGGTGSPGGGGGGGAGYPLNGASPTGGNGGNSASTAGAAGAALSGAGGGGGGSSHNGGAGGSGGVVVTYVTVT